MDISVKKYSRPRNTGKISDGFNPALIVGTFIVPYDFVVEMSSAHFTNESLAADLIAKIKDNLIHDDETQRIRYIGPYEQLTDNSEDPTKQTLGYGKSIIVRDGLPDHAFVFDTGGLQYFHSVLWLRGKHDKYKALHFDKKGNIYATNFYAEIEGDTNGVQAVGVKGFRLNKLYPTNWKLANGDTEAMYGVEIGLADDQELNEHICVIETGEDLAAVAESLSVKDVDLRFSQAATGGIITFSMWIGMHKINLAEVVPSIVNLSNFICINEATGDEIHILSAVPDTNIGAVVVTLDTSDPGYIATRKASLRLADISALAELGFRYYESNKMYFKLPSIS